MKKIVSLQDISCYGQCSLTVALPIISFYGSEVAILPSAILSTHTSGFKDFTVLDLTDELTKIINHWKKENIRFDAIYTGYIGDYKQFDIVLDLKKTMLNGLLIVDPAMADNGQLYPALNKTIIEGMKKIVKEADIILPNITEASFILDMDYKENHSKAEYEEILIKLYKFGAKLPVLTGVMLQKNRIGAMAYDGKNFYFYDTDRLPINFHGTGDIFSSVFIGKYLQHKDILESLKEACDFVYEAILITQDDKNHSYGVHFEEVLSRRKSNIVLNEGGAYEKH